MIARGCVIFLTAIDEFKDYAAPSGNAFVNLMTE